MLTALRATHVTALGQQASVTPQNEATPWVPLFEQQAGKAPPMKGGPLSEGVTKGTINVASIAQQTQIDTAKFAEKLDVWLRAAGVDMSVPVKLEIDNNGAVVVDGDHPDKDIIAGVFAANPQLAQEYQAIASANQWVASAEVASRYTQKVGQIEEVQSDDEKRKKSKEKELQQRAEAAQQQIAQMGDKMTLADGQLSSAAMRFASSFSFA